MNFKVGDKVIFISRYDIPYDENGDVFIIDKLLPDTHECEYRIKHPIHGHTWVVDEENIKHDLHINLLKLKDVYRN